MGNKIGRRRQAVDDKYTRPQGLYQHQCIDRKKLRKLILDSKLAPCYLGDEDCALDLEECPICFLYYPSLNRSRCCTKGICTECFLQMKPPNSTRSTQCPFCKTSNYAVEYRGVRTKEEKGLEQLEEQKVIEAQIRIRQKEQQDDEERTQSRYEMACSGRTVTPLEAENQEISMPSCGKSTQGNELGPSQGSCGVLESKRPSHSGQNREDNFDLDLEEIMVMEAIWLSIQDQGAPTNPSCSSGGLPGPSSSEDAEATESSSSGGFAQAIAALAEHQQMPVGEETGRWIGVPRGSRTAAEFGSEVAEAGTSYASSDANMASRHILPDSFEEQTMLAMAVSLAEARARTVTQELTWPLHM